MRTTTTATCRTCGYAIELWPFGNSAFDRWVHVGIDDAWRAAFSPHLPVPTSTG